MRKPDFKDLVSRTVGFLRDCKSQMQKHGDVCRFLTFGEWKSLNYLQGEVNLYRRRMGKVLSSEDVMSLADIRLICDCEAMAGGAVAKYGRKFSKRARSTILLAEGEKFDPDRLYYMKRPRSA